MSSAFYSQINQQIEDVKSEGLYKSERIITSAQAAAVSISTGEEVLNFCANNYLGLANHPALIEAAKQGMDEHGF
ncbi:MAG: glycine C-acetyltransferase, partial [Vibrio casei]